MKPVPPIYCLVNDGTQLSIYKLDSKAPWFVIEAKKCEGATSEQKHENFADAVNVVRASFGPLADYKEIHAPELPGFKQPTI